MRLNFSGFDEEQIREGIRRIGKVVSEQVALYETITGEHPLPAGSARGSEHDTEERAQPRGHVVPLRRRGEKT
jgi:2-aminoadipate transaminase